MTAAPDAIMALWDSIHAAIPSAQLAGIVGDPNHTYGYHCSRDSLPADDYSCVLQKDKEGAGHYASGLDITMNDDLMRKCTKRLKDAALANDSRLHALREFGGTLDSVVTYAYDLANNVASYGGWDDSHLFHIHLSFYRKWANSEPDLLPIGEVFTGEDDMNKDETISLIAQALRAYHMGGTYGPWNPDDFGNFIKNEQNGVGDRLSELEHPNWPASIHNAFLSYHYGGSHGNWLDSERDWIKDAGNGMGDRVNRLEKGASQ